MSYLLDWCREQKNREQFKYLYFIPVQVSLCFFNTTLNQDFDTKIQYNSFNFLSWQVSCNSTLLANHCDVFLTTHSLQKVLYNGCDHIYRMDAIMFIAWPETVHSEAIVKIRRISMNLLYWGGTICNME